MRCIYLSPHLDDAVYSCGGRIWQQHRQGLEVEIWTICAGDPIGELTPFARQLHVRWGTGLDAVMHRRAEDQAACTLLGVRYRHLAIPDCIYRRIPATGEPTITINDDLFKPVRKGELPLVDQISSLLMKEDLSGAIIYCPLSIGGHVDHRLTRLAAERTGLSPSYYADYPYSADPGVDLTLLLPLNSQQVHYELDESDIGHWIQSAAAYTSQSSTFWASEDQMAEELRAYARTSLGSSYWARIAYSQIT